jgi:hypothetical protein
VLRYSRSREPQAEEDGYARLSWGRAGGDIAGCGPSPIRPARTIGDPSRTQFHDALCTVIAKDLGQPVKFVAEHGADLWHGGPDWYALRLDVTGGTAPTSADFWGYG